MRLRSNHRLESSVYCKAFEESRYAPKSRSCSTVLTKSAVSRSSSKWMTKSYFRSRACSRSSQVKGRNRSDAGSSTAFFEAVIQVTKPPNLESSGVVRTTSPVAPSLTLNTFIMMEGKRRRSASADKMWQGLNSIHDGGAQVKECVLQES